MDQRTTDWFPGDFKKTVKVIKGRTKENSGKHLSKDNVEYP